MTLQETDLHATDEQFRRLSRREISYLVRATTGPTEFHRLGAGICEPVVE